MDENIEFSDSDSYSEISSDISEEIVEYDETDESDIEIFQPFDDKSAASCSCSSYMAQNGAWESAIPEFYEELPLKREQIKIEGLEGSERDFFILFLSKPILTR